MADLGSGAFANLLRYRTAESIDAVVISHMHADHFIDIVPMRYALKYGDRTGDGKVALYLPPGGAAMLKRLVDAFARESSADFLGDVFDVRTYDPQAELRVGEATFRFAPTSHYVPTYAMRCESASLAVAYSADTAPDPRVARLAFEADAFVCEATLSIEDEAERPRGHISAREAGALAHSASAKTLVLSHYPASADPARMTAQAVAEYGGPVTVADDGFRLDLGR